MSDEQNKKARQLITTGSQLVGAAATGALSCLAAGPLGLAAAGVAGVAITKSSTKILGDFADRQLSHREQERVGATAALALDKIRESLESDKKPRESEFFLSDDENRSSAEEILEGTLRKARDEYEERKLEFLSSFYSNLVFSPGVSNTEANYYLRLFDKLTYRQFCVICLVMLNVEQSAYQPLRDSNYRNGDASIGAETISLLQEIYDLNHLGLLACKSADRGYSALLAWHDVVPHALELTGLGKRFQELFLGAFTSKTKIFMRWRIFCANKSLQLTTQSAAALRVPSAASGRSGGN